MTPQTNDPPNDMHPLLDARERLLAYVRRRVGNAELAEDILQDSLLRAMQALPALRQRDQLLPWFYRLLQNAIVDTYRRQGVMRQRTSPLDGVDPPSAPEDDAELCACFEPLIATLKPEYAELLRALDLGGEATDVVAVRLGITHNNLKVRRHRARQALRKRLEETCRTCADHGCLDCTCRGGEPATR